MSSIEKAISRLQNKKKGEASSSENITVSQKYKRNISLEDDCVDKYTVPKEKSVTSSAADQVMRSKGEEIQADEVPVDTEFKSHNKLIALDYIALEQLGFITPVHKIEYLEEEYRIIKRPVLMNAFGKGAAPVPKGNLVMVTSSMPGEGKTFTSFNLAMSVASELDLTVLLVDGDVIRASLSKTLNVEGYAGLTDILEDKVEGVEDVILSTDNPKLKIIPAGSRQSYSTELLASDRMAYIAEELSARYPDRLIIFDAPPLLATTEATVLANLMGQILLVVEAGKSKMHEVKAALSKIADEKVVGLILNKSRKNAAGYYGGYYGGYAGK